MDDRSLDATRAPARALPPPALARLRARLLERELLRPVGRLARRRRQNKQAAVAAIAPCPAGAVRLLTLNIAHGRRRVPHQALVSEQRMRRNLDEVAALVAHLDAAVVALQEADGPSIWSGNFDHVAALAEATHLGAHFRGDHNHFRIGRHNLASGTALVARWPLGGARSQPFGSSWRCTKGFVAASVEVPDWGGQAVDMVSVHLDFLRPEVRRRQIDTLAEALSGRDPSRPLVVLGDLNCCWQQEPESLRLLIRRLGLRAFEPESGHPTYPAYRPRRRLDWILISDHLRFCSHQCLPAKLSDHLGVLADVGLG